jgi:hypothetical protein
MTPAMTFPQPKLPTFNGDVVEYKTFIMAFDARVAAKTTSHSDKFYYLQQQLEGEPKELIGGCLHLTPEEGYKEARRLLDKEYGDTYKISVAYTREIQRWPPIKFEDGAALKRFSFFLTKC